MYGEFKTNRGGSWFDGAVYCRAADRDANHPGDRGAAGGFRLVAPVANIRRVVCGGSWIFDAEYCRATNRVAFRSDGHFGDCGFRLARRAV